jgi:hypothetical protein
MGKSGDWMNLSSKLHFADLAGFYFFVLTQKSNKKGHPDSYREKTGIPGHPNFH